MIELTCEEVNEAIARFRGEEEYDETWDGKEEQVYITYPDYCHDWAAAGMLWNEMPPGSSISKRHESPACAVCCSTSLLGIAVAWADETPEAIARAYHAWRAKGDK